MGSKAAIPTPDYPNKNFTATMPGGYANVQMTLAREGVPLHTSALVIDQDGIRVATVGGDDKIRFKTVRIARDLGRDIELASGPATA